MSDGWLAVVIITGMICITMIALSFLRTREYFTAADLKNKLCCVGKSIEAMNENLEAIFERMPTKERTDDGTPPT